MPQETAATLAKLQINRLNELPPLSMVSQRLLEALSDDGVGLDEIAAVIELDPAVAARIVGVARSAFFGNTTTIFNVKDAIVRVLGLDMVRSLGLSISFGDNLHYEKVKGFDARRYWTTALLTADLARYLAPRVSREDRPAPDPAYLSGLLHNLGLLALAHLFPADLAKAFDEAVDAPFWTLAAAEQRHIGLDHHVAGGRLAQRWHLPGEIVMTMEHYHDPEYRGTFWPTTLLVGTCARWAEWRQLSGTGIPDDILFEFETLGIAAKDMGKITQAFERKYEQTSEMAANLAGAR